MKPNNPDAFVGVVGFRYLNPTYAGVATLLLVCESSFAYTVTLCCSYTTLSKKVISISKTKMLVHNLGSLSLYLVSASCHSPNPIEFAAIVALVAGMIAGLVVIVPISVITTVAIASTVVTMIIDGATLDVIAAAIATELGAVGLSMEVVSRLVDGIKNVLGC